MRIAFVGTLPPHPGGSASVNLNVVTGLARRGHEIAAIAPITAAALEGGDPLNGAPFPVARYEVPRYESAPNHPSSDEFRAHEGERVQSLLRDALRSARPDVILAGRETFAPHVADPARRYDIPWVAIAHGALIWGVLGGRYPPALTRRLVERLGQADRVVAVARHLVAHLGELGLDRVAAIPNAVDVNAFTPTPPDPLLKRSLAIDAGQVVVAHISNMKDIKRPLDFARSAALALRRDPRLAYVVVGDGPEHGALVAECERAGIARHFRFVGWVPYAEMPRYVNLADIVVMPSEVEALALAYLETQACGRVLIASDIAAAREVVDDGETGYLCAVGDVGAFGEATLRAAASAELRAEIGARARAAAIARPLETAVAEYEAVLNDVVREKGLRRQ